MAGSGTLWKDAAGGSGAGDNEESVVSDLFPNGRDYDAEDEDGPF